MPTLNENIQQAINDFDEIQEAILEKGVDVPESTPTEEYGDKIREIETGITPSGTIPIVENGIYNVAEYAEADVECITAYEVMMTQRSGSDSGSDEVSIIPGTVYSLPDTTTCIGPFAFAGIYKLKVVDLSNLTNLECINQYAFYPGDYGDANPHQYEKSWLTNVILPKVTSEWMSIEHNAFEGCSELRSLDLTSAFHIGSDCFSYSGITTLYFSTKLDGFGWDAFEHANNLTDIYYTGTYQEWIAIGNLNNSKLPNTVTIHYEYTPE